MWILRYYNNLTFVACIQIMCIQYLYSEWSLLFTVLNTSCCIHNYCLNAHGSVCTQKMTLKYQFFSSGSSWGVILFSSNALINYGVFVPNSKIKDSLIFWVPDSFFKHFLQLLEQWFQTRGTCNLGATFAVNRGKIVEKFLIWFKRKKSTSTYWTSYIYSFMYYCN